MNINFCNLPIKNYYYILKVINNLSTNDNFLEFKILFYLKYLKFTNLYLFSIVHS